MIQYDIFTLGILNMDRDPGIQNAGRKHGVQAAHCGDPNFCLAWQRHRSGIISLGHFEGTKNADRFWADFQAGVLDIYLF